MHEKMKWTTFFLLLALITLSVSAEEEKKKKPFGLTKGPAYIGGSDIRYNGSELVGRIYKEYRNYRKMAKLSTPEQVAHDAKFADKGLCDLGCPRDTECIGGVCVCGKDKLQIYGQCWGTKYIAVSDAWNDVHRYRKPPDPKKPETCFRTVYEKDREGRRKQKKIIREEMLDVPACKTPPFIRAFDPSEQNCTFVKPCNEKDLNLQCNKDIDRCECRKGTTWNTRTMECQVYLDVDCTDVKDQTPNQDAIKQLRAKGENAVVSPEEARIAFCFLLEEEAALYILQQVDETDFYIFGLSLGAFFAVCCGSICGACCCCKCCADVREKIRNLDPRRRLANMDQTTQMAALGTLAAGEYLDRQEERDDELKAAQLQGVVPPAGYAPVPNQVPPGGGYYPPAQPQAGVPNYGPGYAPPQQGVYPPPAGGVPPPEGNTGLSQYIPGVAPGAVLTGAGLYTGNKEMAAMGIVAMGDKMNMDAEKDHRINVAAASGNVPPPPMGYYGGPQAPQAAPAADPLATANYPRQ